MVRDLDEELLVLAIHGRSSYHPAMHVAPACDNATLVTLGDVSAAELHAAAEAMRAEPGVAAVIPGHSSLYVIRGESPAATVEGRAPQRHRIPVCFDGEDLDELLQRVPRAQFLERVAALELTVRYLGFRGGFAYLDGWPEEWAMPRRPTSRPVQRGAFAIAGSVAGFYPIDTPGGWNVLGRTGEDLEYAFVPGDGIAIEPVTSVQTAAVRPAARTKPDSELAELVNAPLAMRVYASDWSRALRGASPGGPFDDVAAGVARRAVAGSVELFECAMSGPRVRFVRDAWAAWCSPDLRVELRQFRAGEEWNLGRIERGLRGYLALGTEPGAVTVAAARSDRLTIVAMRGPHDTVIESVECEVLPQLNRVGIRLRPLQPLAVTIPSDLRSCGMQCGTVQLHPDGTLVAMGPDHPVTGGYLQPMTVLAGERWKLAQLMPGERVRFVAQSS
jgi:hypothetical protein